MPSAIQFLESLGARPAPSAAEYAAIVSRLEVSDAQRRALLHGDHAVLSELLYGREKMFCVIVAPDDDEHEAIPDQDDDGLPDQDEPMPDPK